VSPRPPQEDGGQGKLPLDGVLVADFSRVLAGPLATMTMADLGATVVKVENPGVGDDTRQWGPPWTPSSSSYFESVNRSKRSVGLDLRDPADLRLAGELAGRADILVENFRVGTLEKFGLGYADVSRANPGVVYCSISGYGSGPGASLPGYDFVVQAVGGLMSITGSPDGEPMKAGVALVDVLAAKDAVIGVLAAMRSRELTGHGQHVEVNLLSSLLGSLVNQASGFLATGRSPSRLGNQHPSIAPYETLQCGDGPIAVACGNDRQFGRLVELLGVGWAVSDPRFATNAARVEHRADLVTLLEAQLATKGAAEWEQLLVAADVPAGRVGDLASAFDRAEQLGLDPTVSLGDGHPRQVRHPVRYSQMRPRAPQPPPRLGQHDEQLRGWLSSPDASLAELCHDHAQEPTPPG
jgi:crotonobetainyl-CoA:carnitine CoA-transferase CaiB-like acyl-CoA transferase